MKTYFVIYGEAQRGFDELKGKEFIEGEDPVKIVLDILNTKFNGQYGEVCKDYVLEWGDEERPGIFCFSDDWGSYIYVGEDKLEVLNLWSEYLVK